MKGFSLQGDVHDDDVLWRFQVVNVQPPQIRKQVGQEQDVRYRRQHFTKDQGLDGLEMAEAGGDRVTVEGREVHEEEG
jgi:hypothetical protein